MISEGPGKPGNNVLNNGDFENGSAGWTFYTNGAGSFSAAGPAYGGSLAGKIAVVQTGNNVQLYQSGIALQPSTVYRLSFVAYSNTGHDLSVGLMQHVSPYTNYGLWTRKVDLSQGWKADTVYLRTTGFTSPVTDARLQFWFPAFAAAGDLYWIDDVVLEEAPAPAVPASPHFVSPLPMARDQSLTLPIQWSASALADAYDLELASDSLFTRMVVDTVVADTMATVGPLQSNTRYYRRVRAINISGTAATVPTCCFNTKIMKTDIPSPEDVPTVFALGQNYPNPFNPIDHAPVFAADQVAGLVNGAQYTGCRGGEFWNRVNNLPAHMKCRSMLPGWQAGHLLHPPCAGVHRNKANGSGEIVWNHAARVIAAAWRLPVLWLFPPCSCDDLPLQNCTRHPFFFEVLYVAPQLQCHQRSDCTGRIWSRIPTARQVTPGTVCLGCRESECGPPGSLKNLNFRVSYCILLPTNVHLKEFS